MAQRSSSTVAIIGAGFAGLGLAYYLKRAGIESFVIFEKASDVGGVWRENTYPGSGCDVPSHLYSFSFEANYPWGWRYAKQPEILEYQRHCARKYQILPHIRFQAEVSGASFDEARGVWVIRLANGDLHEAKFLVSGVGQLSRPAYPKLKGIENFQGKVFHSAEWQHDYDLRGKKVAVIGTGASAVQFVPEIAKQVAQLHLFQRTPGWVIRKVEKAFPDWLRALTRKVPFLLALDRLRIFFITEVVAAGYNGNKFLERALTTFCKWRLKNQIADPVLRAKLTPDYPVGCKRILLSNDWYPTMTRPNVEVVTDAVQEVGARAVVTADGRQREVDAIIYGTGFTGTDFLAPLKIEGLERKDLRQQWRGAAQAYLGMAVSGFPNFFMMYGPNTNVGSGSIVFMLECQQKYITQMVSDQRRAGWCYANLQVTAEKTYAEEIRRRSAGTTFEASCQSWYKNAEGLNINNWVGDMREFARRTAQPELSAYRVVPLPQIEPLRQAA